MIHSRFWAVVVALVLAAPLGILVSCANRDSSDGAGSAAVVLTDAPLDEIDVFEVDVAGIDFHKLSGATVSVLPRTTRVDFTSLEDLGDLVARVSLEAGYYTGLTLTLDFTNATVYLKDKTTPARVIDSNAAPITGTVPVRINFSFQDRPFVVAGRFHMFMLDLDLNHALTVNATNNEVEFEPAISAEVDPVLPKPIAATGYLKSVDGQNNVFTIEKRGLSGGVLATIPVHVHALTLYQVSGTNYIGTNGLAALAGLPLGTTRVFVQGTLNASLGRFTAAAVESGAGTFGNGQDWVEGLIVGRSSGAGGDTTLTVLGRSVNVTSQVRTFNTSHTVQVSYLNTKVLKRGAGNQLNTDALQVGQRLIAFGSLSGIVLDATAATGVVRMIRTSVYGIAAGAPVGDRLTLNLARIGLRPIGAFNFTVGGNPESNPTAYTVDVTGINTTGITSGSKIRAMGWVNPVGVSADPDFDAISIVNRSTQAQFLFTLWPSSSLAQVTSVNATSMVLDVSDAFLKLVDDGFGAVTLQNTPAPTIQPAGLLGIYRIIQNGGVELHFTFGTFTTSLNGRLTPTTWVRRISALGSFDPQTQVFSAGIMTVVLDEK